MRACILMYLVYHDVHSVAKLVEIAKMAFAFPHVNVFVISRAQGNAAQTGVPEVHMRAYRAGKKLLVVPDLKDAVELLKPDKVIIIARKAEKPFEPREITEHTMVVVCGTEPDVTKFDANDYELRYIEPREAGEMAATATVLFLTHK